MTLFWRKKRNFAVLFKNRHLIIGMKAFVFPGQGAQFVGMGKDLYDNNPVAREMFEKANEVLGFRITDLMFEGTDEDLRQTKVTQPAIFLHSVILAKTLGDEFKPEMTAGHSLGEFSALVAAGALNFEDGLRLVSARAQAMQKACELKPSTMAAVLALPDEKVEEICAGIDGVVVCANYNCPGQIVITGEESAVAAASAKLQEAGAKRCIPLKVSGPFHSALLKGAGEKLAAELVNVKVSAPVIPYICNVEADYVTDSVNVKELLACQVSGTVRWRETMEKMLTDGVDTFIEVGPGKTLAGFLKKMSRDVKVMNVETVENLNAVLTELGL
mgnify:CR=1 FL=1